MNQFKGLDDIPDRYIEDAIRAINIQVQLGESAKILMKPKVYDLFKVYGHT